MSIKVVIDGVTDVNSTIFHPGETIRGSVKYKITKQRTIQNATLKLEGSLKAEYIPVQQNSSAMTLLQGPRRPNKLSRILLENNTKLFDGPYDVPPQEFEWPFEFTIPWTTEIAMPTQQNEGQSVNVQMDLPPSYNWYNQAIAHTVHAQVAYRLIVKIECSGLLKNDSLEQILTIRRQRDASEPITELKPRRHDLPPISWSSQDLRPAERRLSLGQKMKSKVSKDPALRAPTLTFTSAVYVPDSIGISQRFDVNFSLSYKRESENDPEDPTFVLAKLRLTWSERTTMNMPKTGLFTHETRCQNELILARREIDLNRGIEVLGEGQLIEIAKDVCVNDWLEKSSATLPGDFDIFVIQLHYRLAVELEVKHEESGKVFRLSTSCPIRLVDEISNEAPKYQAESSSTTDHEQLPAYGQVDQTTSATQKLMHRN